MSEVKNKRKRVRRQEGVLSRVSEQHFCEEKREDNYYNIFYIYDSKENTFSDCYVELKSFTFGEPRIYGGIDKTKMLLKKDISDNYTTTKIFNRNRHRKALLSKFYDNRIVFEYSIDNKSILCNNEDLQRFTDPRLPKKIKSIVVIDLVSGDYAVTKYEDEKIRLQQNGKIDKEIIEDTSNLKIDFIIVNGLTTFLIENEKSKDNHSQLLTLGALFEYNRWNEFKFISYGNAKITLFDDDGNESVSYNQISVKDKATSIFANSSVSFEQFDTVEYKDNSMEIKRYKRGSKISAFPDAQNLNVVIDGTVLNKNLDINIPNLIDIGKSITLSPRVAGTYIDYTDFTDKVIQDVCTYTDSGFEWTLLVITDDKTDVIRTISYNKFNDIITYKDADTILQYEMKINFDNGKIEYYRDNDFLYFADPLNSFQFQSSWLFCDEALIRANQFGIPTMKIR